MTLNKPFQITPSLMAGLKIGEAWVSLEYSKREGREGRTRFHWQIVLADGQEFNGEDLQGPRIQVAGSRGPLECAFSDLLSFLTAAGESYRHNGCTMKEDSNTCFFPEPVCEWAYVNSYELDVVMFQIEESKTPLIEE